MAYTVEDFRKHYRTLSDETIMSLAVFESESLQKEAIQVLKEEISRRKLDGVIADWEAFKNAPKLTSFERQAVFHKIKNAPCPVCNKKRSKLQGHRIYTVILGNSKVEEIIACKRCGNIKRSKAILYSGLFGWWLSAGIFLTPYYLIKNIISFWFYKETSDIIIESFIDLNNTTLKQNPDNDKMLMKLLRDFDNIEIDYY